MQRVVRVIATVTLLAAVLSGSSSLAAQREPVRRGGSATVFARFIAWVNSRLSPPIGSDSRLSPPIGAPQPQPESRLSPPIGIEPPPTTP